MKPPETKPGADGWIELPVESGPRRFAKPIPGTHGERGTVLYEHELPAAVRERFQRGVAVRQGSTLVWSSDYPKSPGLYWVRYQGQRRAIAEITGEPGNLKQTFYGVPVGLHNLPKDLEWQWAGPIPEPQEQHH